MHFSAANNDLLNDKIVGLDEPWAEFFAVRGIIAQLLYSEITLKRLRKKDSDDHASSLRELKIVERKLAGFCRGLAEQNMTAAQVAQRISNMLEITPPVSSLKLEQLAAMYGYYYIEGGRVRVTQRKLDDF